jgi:hypothetical protein
MIDRHGEYSAAVKDCGELFNADSLQLPYPCPPPPDWRARGLSSRQQRLGGRCWGLA